MNKLNLTLEHTENLQDTISIKIVPSHDRNSKNTSKSVLSIEEFSLCKKNVNLKTN